MLDIYPTLLELSEHAADDKLQGHSLVPLLKNPQADWPHMARCSFGPGNYAVISEFYRYIHYQDKSEEFYDLRRDKHEWNNLIGNPEYRQIIDRHRAQKPRSFHPVLGKDSTGHKALAASEKENK